MKYQPQADATEERTQRRKEKIRKSLKSQNDMKPLQATFDGLINETARNEDELILLLNNLNDAIKDCKKKALPFAIRQGLLLHQAKGTYKRVRATYKHIVSSCNISPSYANFLISLWRLSEKYPRLNYCAVPIRMFRNNMKTINEICEDVFWSNLS